MFIGFAGIGPHYFFLQPAGFTDIYLSEVVGQQL
jgi:hypothetical protein